MDFITVLVKDIYPGNYSYYGPYYSFTEPNSSSPRDFVKADGSLFFIATTDTGRELWKSDGTAAGTVLVKDINPGSSDSYPLSLTEVNDTLFFSADDSVNGRELWKSDGTEAGTVLLKDIRPGAGSSYLSGLAEFSSSLFFVANDGASGSELWKSDGTAAGTVLFKDINPGSDSSSPTFLTEVNGTLFFRANDGTNGSELWKTDGTEAGTVLVKNIRSGGSGSYPNFFAEVNGNLFFSANDGINGFELWKTDGTEAGTVLITDINSGSGSSNPKNFTEVNGTIFFSANDGINGSELWKTDGTAAGTVLVKDIRPGNFGSSLSDLTEFNDSLFFRATDGANGFELWKSDGTAAGTVLVKNINSGSGNSNPDSFTEFNGKLFFSANMLDGGSDDLWATDGTSAGTVLVQNFRGVGSNTVSGDFTEFNGSLLFPADGGTGRELWALVPEGLDPETGIISNRVWFDANENGVFNSGEPGVPGVEVLLTGAGPDAVFNTTDDTSATKTTNAQGYYRFQNLAAGNYRVSLNSLPTNRDYTLANVGSNERLDSDIDPVTGITDVIGLTPGERNSNIDIGLVETESSVDPGTGIISNKVWLDANENGLLDSGEAGVSDVTVLLTGAGPDSLFDTADDITATKTTNASGNYRFQNLLGGTYQVSLESLPAGLDYTMANVGNNEALDSDVDPLTGTTGPIVLAPAEVNSKVDIGLINAPVDSNTGIISNLVWLEANDNGLFDAGESGISGLTVVLEAANANGIFDTVATKLTNASGQYRFQNLPGGDYRISLASLPTGRSYTTPNVGANEAIDSDVLPSTGTTEIITLAPGEVNAQIDIGLT